MPTPKNKIGLALGGGVVRCLAHIGVLQVLDEHNIPIDIVTGTSGGSLIGAAYAAGMSARQIAGAARGLAWRSLVKLRLRREGVLDARGLEELLHRVVGPLTFDELKRPFAAIATDISSGDEVVLQNGPVSLAVRASCAIPAVFIPVRIDGRTLVDGGLTNPLPVTTARQLGATRVIAVDVSPSLAQMGQPRNLVQIIVHSLNIMQQDSVQTCRTNADVCILPNLGDLGYTELDRITDFIRAGRKAAQAALPDIERLIN